MLFCLEMFSLIFVYFIFISWIPLTFAYVNDSYWLIVQNDYAPIPSNFNPPTFRKHPRRYGKHLNSTYPALYLRNGKLVFGQTNDGPNVNGSYCAVFNVDSDNVGDCKEFRILQNIEKNKNDYYLIKPEMFDHLLDDPIGFDDKFLVIIYDYYTDSSFFGTLHRPIDGQEPEVHAIDYENAPVELRGKSATSNGDFIMFVVRQRPFFQSPFYGLCRPINEQDSTFENEQNLKLGDQENMENEKNLEEETDTEHNETFEQENNWFLV